MKAVILAGGFGTRIGEESAVKPKPMIEIGEKPILWHIMKAYSYHKCNEFVICLGYKGYLIKEYFANYLLHESDITFDYRAGAKKIVHNNSAEKWGVTLVNTGIETMTGGRIKKIKPYIDDQAFMLTYGDGVSDIDIPDLLKFHKQHKKLATVTAVRPLGRFGALSVGKNNMVRKFQEKAEGDNSWINAGYFVLEPEVFDYIDGDKSIFEREPLEKLAKEGELVAYQHEGFWHPMDTQRDKRYLEDLWNNGEAPWKVWD